MRELEAQLRAYGPVLDAARPSMVDTVDAVPLRVRRSLVVAAAAAFVVAIAASAIVFGVARAGNSHRPQIVTPNPSGPLTTVDSKSVTTNVPAHLIVTAIGDSVMEDAAGALREAIPGITVDTERSRQPSQSIVVLDGYAKAGTLPATVVVALGTNGRITPGVLDDIMRAAGDRRVYFVTIRVPRAWQNDDNAQLRALPSRWPNAHVIDWHEDANSHGDWFLQDGFHLTTAGQHAYATLIATTLGVPAVTPTTVATGAGGIGVVDVFPGGGRPYPLAVAAGDVWIASQVVTDSTPSVPLERRDPSTAKLLGTTDVPQETVFGVAGDGDTLWAAGGGDGGVSRTTVSRVDARTGKVVFTKTLDGTVCSCPIVAGSAGVWLVGNGHTSAFHLSPRDGHVTGTVRLSGHVATSAMETRARLLVGLDDGTIAVIDPSHDRIERTIAHATGGDPPAENVIAMSPAAIPAAGSDPALDVLLLRANGTVDALPSDSWVPRSIASTTFGASTVAGIPGAAIVLGGNRAALVLGHASYVGGYDPATRRFAGGLANPGAGFRSAVAAGDRLWVVYDPRSGEIPTIVVVRFPSASP